MKLEHILNSHGKVVSRKIDDRLEVLSESLFADGIQQIPGLISKMEPTEQGKYMIKLATDWLTYDCSSKEYNKAGYVIVVEHLYHEHRHVQQFTTEQNTIIRNSNLSSIRQMTDIIRRNITSNFYASAHYNNYRNDPSEMDAEVYSIEKAIEYFKNDPIISCKEAKEILFQTMMSEEYGHQKELKAYNPTSIEDVLLSFTDLRRESINKMYTITLDIAPEFKNCKIPEYDMTEVFLNSDEFEPFRNEMKNCKTGKELDKLLLQTIVLKHPEIIDVVPRLRDEMLECRKEMTSGIIFKRLNVVPVSEINYAGKPAENSELYNKEEQEEFASSLYKISESENKSLGG